MSIDWTINTTTKGLENHISSLDQDRCWNDQIIYIEPLVQVINFSTEKTWQYPRISVDIATSKCFFCCGNFFVAIATTPNLRRYIHAWSSLYPWLAVAVSTDFRRCIHGLAVAVSTAGRRCIHGFPSLYPRLWNFLKKCRRCIHGYNCFKKKNTNATRPIPCGSRSEASHTLESYVEQRVRRGQFRRLFVV